MITENIKHIFFDLDHTLWDFDKNSGLAFADIFAVHFKEIDVDKFMEVYIPINQECWRLYQTDQITHSELRYNRFKHSFDAICVVISDDEIDFIAEKYLEILPAKNHLIEDAIEILEQLKNSYQLHVITNGFLEVQQKKMQNSGLHVYFQSVTNSEMAGAKKPHPKIFQTALNSAEATNKNSIMIGDSWEADIVGAMNFDMPAIYFNQHNNEIDSVEKNKYQTKYIEIKALSEIKNLL